MPATREKRPRRWSTTETALVIALAVTLVGAGVWVAAGKGVRLPTFSLPADHGVSADDPDWLRCAAETIERHPRPVGAQSGFLIQSVDGTWLLRGRWTDKQIRVDDGLLRYASPGSGDFRRMPVDCPDVSISGTISTPP